MKKKSEAMLAFMAQAREIGGVLQKDGLMVTAPCACCGKRMELAETSAYNPNTGAVVCLTCLRDMTYGSRKLPVLDALDDMYDLRGAGAEVGHHTNRLIKKAMGCD